MSENMSLLDSSPVNNTHLELATMDPNTSDNNGTVLDEFFIYPTIRQPVPMIVIYSLAYALIFLLGVTGNSLVISIVYRNVRMHNVTNYFIVNLAVADMLVCIFCLPITLLSNLYSGWRFGAVMCKVTPFLQGAAVSASVNTLTAIAVDRYFAICHTLEFRMTRKMARIGILLIWLTAGAIITPWAVYYKQVDVSTKWQELYQCEQRWPIVEGERIYFLVAIFIMFYTFPLILISVCYTFIALRVWFRDAPGVANTSQTIYRSKVKVLKMLIVVVILFALSWLPLYAIQLRRYFGPDMVHNSTEFNLVYQILVPIAQWLGASNSCVNPIIYCFFSKKFRKGFTDFAFCCKKTQSNGFMRNSSTMYRSVNDGNNHTMYTSIRNQAIHERRIEKMDKHKTTSF